MVASNLIVKSTTFPHHDIHKHAWTSPEGVPHNQIDHVLIDKRQHSNILDILSLRGADCDTDHYLVVAKLRERISVNKHARQKFDLERFDLKKLNDTEYQVGLELYGTHQLLVYVDDVNLVGDSINTIKENKESLLEARRDIGLEINAEKTKYMSYHPN
jgi:hypothetical protein